MRATIAALVLLISLGSPAQAQKIASLDAINRCEAFVETALRPEIPARAKTNYKIVCYFAMMDADIAAGPEGVCARLASTLPRPHDEIAQFLCLGTYRTYFAGQ